jgi:hypothetical protein
MVARRLIGQFVEAADEVLEDESHLLVRHCIRVQVHITELRDDEEQEVRLTHLFDLALELEEIENGADIGREPFDVADEMLCDVVRVALQFLEVERRMIVETLTGGIVEHPVEGVVIEPAAFAPLVFRQHFCLRRSQHAIEATQHGHRQHDPLVLRRTVGTAQQIGNLPDEIGEIAMARHC